MRRPTTKMRPHRGCPKPHCRSLSHAQRGSALGLRTQPGSGATQPLHHYSHRPQPSRTMVSAGNFCGGERTPQSVVRHRSHPHCPAALTSRSAQASRAHRQPLPLRRPCQLPASDPLPRSNFCTSEGRNGRCHLRSPSSPSHRLYCKHVHRAPPGRPGRGPPPPHANRSEMASAANTDPL